MEEETKCHIGSRTNLEHAEPWNFRNALFGDVRYVCNNMMIMITCHSITIPQPCSKTSANEEFIIAIIVLFAIKNSIAQEISKCI